MNTLRSTDEFITKVGFKFSRDLRRGRKSITDDFYLLSLGLQVSFKVTRFFFKLTNYFHLNALLGFNAENMKVPLPSFVLKFMNRLEVSRWTRSLHSQIRSLYYCSTIQRWIFRLERDKNEFFYSQVKLNFQKKFLTLSRVCMVATAAQKKFCGLALFIANITSWILWKKLWLNVDDDQPVLMNTN